MLLPVSACLLGIPCRYDGASKPLTALLPLMEKHQLLPLCPEIFGGLSIPRTPAERQGDRVRTADGRDVTAEYDRGAQALLNAVQATGCNCVLLKERSPACGCGQIYDGSFGRRLIEGDGVAAELLKRHGIRVFGESQYKEWREALGI